MNKTVRLIFYALILSGYLNICNAQIKDTTYSKLIDSSLTAMGKISLKIKGNFKLTKQQDAAGTRKVEFKSTTDYIVAKTWYNIEDSMAGKIIDDKKFLIENLYKTQPSPYPDVVSNEVDCPERLKPVRFDTLYPNLRIFAFRLYANDRYIYGECTDDVIVYKSAYILAYNIHEKMLTEIRYFTPKLKPVNVPEKVMRSVK